jgi:hypothetical protein
MSLAAALAALRDAPASPQIVGVARLYFEFSILW